MVSTLQIIVWAVFFISLYIIVFWLLTFMEYIDKKPKKIKNLPLVTIAIPAWNEEKTIEKTINSVIDLEYPKNLIEIIVINDGSKDNTSKIVMDIIKHNRNVDIRLINQNNAGKGAALNKALKESKGGIFVVLDADSFVDKESLINMIHTFSSNDVAVVLPLMKLNNPKSWIQKLQWVEYVINFFYKSLNSVLNCVHVAPGPFSAYRKKILIELGGFDEKNLTEDLEITLRIQKANYRVVQLTNAIVYTNAPSSLMSFYKQRNRWYKGTMFNLFSYKKMLMNVKYGDFGVLQMPQILISGFLAVLLIFLTL
jgi:cellulose synthase/poly-beta-1,6-N-acetylglucosamine synthase-like glycosyltransferase